MRSKQVRGSVMRRVASLLLIAIVMASPWLVGDTSGGSEPLTVIVTYPNGEYRVGDVVIARAYIFRNGERFDPDEVEFTAGADYIEYPMERLTGGLYEGSVRITEDQVDRSVLSASFPIEVTVKAETPEFEWTWDYKYIRVLDVPHFHVYGHVEDPGDLTPEPGQAVEFWVTTTYGNRFADPDEGSLRAWVNASLVPFSEEISMTRVSEGNFRGTFTVPDDLTSDGEYTIRVTADRTGTNGLEHDRYWESIYLKYFDVWFRHLVQTDNPLIPQVYVCDMDGDPVEGAELAVNVTYIDLAGQWVRRQVNVTTDAGGLANLGIDHSDINSSFWGIYADGECSANGRTQQVSVWGENPLYYQPFNGHRDGLYALPLGEFFVDPGRSLDLEYLITYNSTPLADTPVDCYVNYPHEILFFGRLRTDGEGILSINLDIPNDLPRGGEWGGMKILFKAMTPEGLEEAAAGLETSNWDWEWQGRGWRSYNTSLELSDLGNGVYVVEVRSADLDGVNETVYVRWGLGTYGTEEGSLYPEWFRDSRYGFDSPPAITWNGECYKGTIHLPEFLGDDTVINVRVIIQHLDMPHSDNRYVYAVNATAYAATTAPTVEIMMPKDGATLDDSFDILLEATDDVKVTRIGLRIDGGRWMYADGTDVWEMTMEGGDLTDGVHVLEARAFDGLRFSDMDRVEFDYEVKEVLAFDTTPFWILLVVLVALVTVVIIVLTRNKGSRDDYAGQP